MNEPKSFVIEATLTIRYNGQKYTIESNIEPVYTDEFPEGLNLAVDRMRDAQSTLWGVNLPPSHHFAAGSL